MCASCAESCLASESTQLHMKDVNHDILKHPDHQTSTLSEDAVVDSMWLDSEIDPPVFPAHIPANANVLLDPKGVSCNENGQFTLTLCTTCWHHSFEKKHLHLPLLIT
jgi:hypothetical protein